MEVLWKLNMSSTEARLIKLDIKFAATVFTTSNWDITEIWPNKVSMIFCRPPICEQINSAFSSSEIVWEWQILVKTFSAETTYNLVQFVAEGLNNPTLGLGVDCVAKEWKHSNVGELERLKGALFFRQRSPAEWYQSIILQYLSHYKRTFLFPFQRLDLDGAIHRCWPHVSWGKTKTVSDICLQSDLNINEKWEIKDLIMIDLPNNVALRSKGQQ